MTEEKDNKKQEIRSFADFAKDDEQPLDGEKVKLDHFLNKEIIITKIKVKSSKYKDKSPNYATVQFYEPENSTRRIFFTGSSVVIKQLEKYEDMIPFKTIIKKIDRYYTLT